MRLVILLCLFVLLTPTVSADKVDYTDDRLIKVSLEAQANKLHKEGKTVENKTLQEQLAERKHYDAAPPVARDLCKDGEGLFDTVDDGVLIVAGCYLCGRCDKLHAGGASGFVISEDGLAVTNYHVVENEKNLTMVAMTRDKKVYPVVEVLAANKADDVALIRLGGEGVKFTPVPLARSAEVGERVHAITHPSGRYYYYTSGEIARFYMQRSSRRGDGVRRVGITAEYAKGSSGGPIFNDEGQVVAMVSSTNTVYYNVENGDPRNPQMVFRNCVPFESILDLFQPKAND